MNTGFALAKSCHLVGNVDRVSAALRNASSARGANKVLSISAAIIHPTRSPQITAQSRLTFFIAAEHLVACHDILDSCISVALSRPGKKHADQLRTF